MSGVIFKYFEYKNYKLSKRNIIYTLYEKKINNILCYSISCYCNVSVSEGDSDTFQVSEEGTELTGPVLSLKKVLDREDVEQHNLRVVATNNQNNLNVEDARQNLLITVMVRRLLTCQYTSIQFVSNYASPLGEPLSCNIIAA